MSDQSAPLDLYLQRLVQERDLLRDARHRDRSRSSPGIVERNAQGEMFGLLVEPGEVDRLIAEFRPSAGVGPAKRLLRMALADAARLNLYAVLGPLLMETDAAHDALIDATEDGDWSAAFVRHGECLTALMHHREAVKATVQTLPAEPTVSRPAFAPSRKGRGRNINALMLQTLATRPESLQWSATQWAEHLDCSDGTIKGTAAWKQTLKAARALAQAGALERAARRRA